MDDGLYDNVVTCRRECWVKGHVRDYVAARIIQEAPPGLFNATWSARWGTYPDVPRRTVVAIKAGDTVLVDARLFRVRRLPRSPSAKGTVVAVHGDLLRVRFSGDVRRTVHKSHASRIREVHGCRRGR